MTLKHKLIAVTAISQIWAATALAGQAGDWQLAMIHDPSAAQLNKAATSADDSGSTGGQADGASDDCD